jgi:hypothetical protein
LAAFSFVSYIEEAERRFLQIADDFAWLNPHLTITAAWNGRRRVERKATKPDWRKWRPSEPTSAHWYDLARLNRYMSAHIARDQDLGRERTVREFISEFRGLSGSAKQKAVLDEIGAVRSSLAGYFGRGSGRGAPRGHRRLGQAAQGGGAPRRGAAPSPRSPGPRARRQREGSRLFGDGPGLRQGQ